MMKHSLEHLDVSRAEEYLQVLVMMTCPLVHGMQSLSYVLTNVHRCPPQSRRARHNCSGLYARVEGQQARGRAHNIIDA